MNEPVMQLQGVVKGFGRAGPAVLKGVDLDVPPGTVMGLLGKNGAGKSTLIKCALGLLRIQGGKSTVFGEDSWDLSPAAKERLGYVPQEVVLYHWMKARQVIAYTASFYPAWNHSLAQKLIERLEIDPEARVGRLSPGELQRLAILLAMGHEPNLLVLDEPVASLDPVGRRDFLRMILELIGGGERTVLFSTHITSDLERVADRVAILRGGKIDYCGELDALKDEVKRLCIYPREGERMPEDVWPAGARPMAATAAGTPRLREGGRVRLGEVDVDLLRCEREEDRVMLTLRGVTSGVIQQIEQRFPVRVEVEDLNLEDIFLELHHAS